MSKGAGLVPREEEQQISLSSLAIYSISLILWEIRVLNPKNRSFL
jgi:hypothetical protein